MKKVYKCFITHERNKHDRNEYIVREKESGGKLEFVCDGYFSQGELQLFLSKAYKTVGGKLLTKTDTSEYVLVEGDVQEVSDDGTIKMFWDDSLNYSHQIENQYIPAQFTLAGEQIDCQCLKSVTDNGFALAYVAERFITDLLCLTAVQQNWKAIQCVPQNMITEEIAIEAIKQNKCAAKYVPESIRNRKKVIKAMRKYGTIEIRFKGYDKESDKFLVDGFFCINAYKYERIYKQFDSFDEFYNYLQGELLDADLSKYKFKGVDLTAYNLDNVVVPAAVLKKAGLYDDSFYKENILACMEDSRAKTLNCNQVAKAKSEVSIQVDFTSREENARFFYISDIHLEEKIQKKFPKHATETETVCFIRGIVKDLVQSKKIRRRGWGEDYLLIAGDVISLSYPCVEIFYRELVEQWGNPNSIITILGNHELFSLGLSNPVDETIDVYRNMFESLGITFLHNELLLKKSDDLIKITEKELREISEKELKSKHCDAQFAILGSTGFTAYNEKYRMLPFEEDMEQTTRFNTLYKKVDKILGKIKVIVLTHMLKDDWLPGKFNKNWVYVSGHTHMNNLIVNKNVTLYADNQIGTGHRNSVFSLKSFYLSVRYDIFLFYEDGIYEITKEQYKKFYQGLGIKMTLNRTGFKIYMLKRNGIYCFIQKRYDTGEIHLLDGGSNKNLHIQDINYYYDNLEQYAVQVCNKMAKPILALEHIAKAVKSFGGTGFIHGCIVDIDYLNHIYLNPYDGKVTPYYAESIDSKYAYGALPKLLSERCPKLYENYMKLLKEETTAITIFNSTGLEESNEVYYVEETDIYRPSRTIRKLQYITENNIIRLWDDNFLKSILQEDILFLE